MPLQFAANISTMFREHDSMLKRYQMAKDAGFSAVECQFPYEYDVTDLCSAKEDACVKHVLINSFPGTEGKFGFALDSTQKFWGELNSSLHYAQALNCERIHILAGIKEPSLTAAAMENAFRQNLLYAAKVLEQEKIVGLLEPICREVKPGYFLNNFDTAVRCIQLIGSPYLKLLLDVYHLQMISGNLTNSIKKYFPDIGHIQISQAPNRDEPNAPGEINYQYIFQLLELLRYDGYVGLEYNPKGETVEGLSWMKEYGYA